MNRVQRVLGWVAGLIVVQYLVAFVWRALHKTHVPYEVRTVNPFTWKTENNFSDLTDYLSKTGHLHGAKALATGLPVYNYPAPAAFVYSAFFHIPHWTMAFTAIVVGSVLSLLAVWILAIRRLSLNDRVTAPAIAFALLTTLLSYPFEYLLWRSNLEGIAFIFFALGFAAFLAQRNLTAALCWGLGICIKPFPVFLFLLLLRRRKFRDIACGVAVAVALEITALKALGPTVLQAFRDLSAGVVLYKHIYIQYFRLIEARFQHGILDSMKVIAWGLSDDDWADTEDVPILLTLYRVYLVLAPAFAVGVALWFWRKAVLNQIFAIVAAVLLLAPVGADYTLVLLHLALAAWTLWLVRDVASGRAEMSQRGLFALALPFAILLAPQNWLSYYTGVLHTAALLALLVAAGLLPMRSSLLGDLDPGQPL